MKIMLILTGIFNIADYFFSLRAFEAGMAEGNPVMDAILHTAWFPVAKLIAVPVGLYLLWKAKERVSRVKYYASVPFLAYSALMAYHLYLFFTGYGA